MKQINHLVELKLVYIFAQIKFYAEIKFASSIKYKV